jgi:hypothetical protein
MTGISRLKLRIWPPPEKSYNWYTPQKKEKGQKLFWLQNSEEQKVYSISRYVDWHKADDSEEIK